MQNEIRWLKISCRIGAIADFIAGVAMVYPEIFARIYKIENFNPDYAYRVAMFLGASLMFGWTVLLLWADRKPAERKGVLLITLIPILGLAASQAYAVATGFIALARMYPTWIFQLFLVILFSFSYFKANRNQ